MISFPTKTSLPILKRKCRLFPICRYLSIFEKRIIISMIQNIRRNSVIVMIIDQWIIPLAPLRNLFRNCSAVCLILMIDRCFFAQWLFIDINSNRVNILDKWKFFIYRTSWISTCYRWLNTREGRKTFYSSGWNASMSINFRWRR